MRDIDYLTEAHLIRTCLPSGKMWEAFNATPEGDEKKVARIVLEAHAKAINFYARGKVREAIRELNIITTEKYLYQWQNLLGNLSINKPLTIDETRRNLIIKAFGMKLKTAASIQALIKTVYGVDCKITNVRDYIVDNSLNFDFTFDFYLFSKKKHQVVVELPADLLGVFPKPPYFWPVYWRRVQGTMAESIKEALRLILPANTYVHYFYNL